MNPLEIKKDVHWVGAIDLKIRIFDVIMRAPHGTTYNSYLVKGKEKTALIEGVKDNFEDQLYARLKPLIDLKKIDYLILNHTEPDHSGTLEKILARVPTLKVVVAKNAEHFIAHLLNRQIELTKVGDGDSLDLGGKTLKFISAPFLHWPDTMFTYLPEEEILFPCDFLGCHFADERLFNDLVEDFDYAFKYYFETIMRPFKEHSRSALEKIKDLKIQIIAPSHGPILRKNIERYIDRYREWSASPRNERPRVLIFYASSYGNTARMARAISEGAGSAGAEVTTYDLLSADISAAPGLIEYADVVIIGSTTIAGDAVKPVWDLLSSLATVKLKGKIGGVFGSYGWSGEAIKMIEERLRHLKFRLPEAAVTTILVPTEDNLKQSFEFGKKLARAAAA